MNWITKRPHDAATLAWIDRGIKRPVGARRRFAYSQVGADIVGLRDEPTLFYTDEDIRNYQVELVGRMNRIDETLRQAQSPRLADWTKAKAVIQAFLHEKPKPLGTVNTLLSLPFAGQSPPNIWNSMLWSKGKNAERVLETWDDIVQTMAPYGPPAMPGVPGGTPGGYPGGLPGGVAPWYNRLQGGARDPWAEARRLADEAREQAKKAAEKASGFPDWKDVQPYVIGGGALMGIMALASMMKSIRG